MNTPTETQNNYVFIYGNGHARYFYADSNEQALKTAQEYVADNGHRLQSLAKIVHWE